MKHLITLLIILSLPALLSGATQKIKRGQTIEQTTQILGDPVGSIVLGDKTILIYPQGKVTLLKNKVSTIDLMSDIEFAAELERKRFEREEWLIQQEKRSAARLKEGTRIKAERLTSIAFISLPAKNRFDYWRSFQIRYPEVDVTEQISQTLEAHKVELAALETEKRIAELEARTARAEQAAAEAARENDRLNNRLFTQPCAYNTILPYRPYYPQRQVVVRSGSRNVTRHPSACYGNHRNKRKEVLVNNESESTAERASRILNSSYRK